MPVKDNKQKKQVRIANTDNQKKGKIGGASIKPKVEKSDSETEENENESEEGDTKLRYDATQHDNTAEGEEGEEGDAGDWDGNDLDDVEGDAEEETDEESAEESNADEEIEMGGEEGDDDCAYDVTRKTKGSKKLGAMIDKEDDDDDEGADFNVDENELTSDLYVKPEDRRSSDHLFLYEKVRLLGNRTAQLAQGAKPMIKNVEGLDPRTVAQLELESKMIPIKIIRPLPNGKKEIWGLNELRLKKKYIIYGFTGGEVDRQKVQEIKEEYQKGGSITGYYNLTDNMRTKIEPTLLSSTMTTKVTKNTQKKETKLSRK